MTIQQNQPIPVLADTEMIALNSPQSEQMTKKVIIVGAGPCGLLLAHYLLHRTAKYQVEIYERRSDPRLVSLDNSRTIPYGLSERGLKALRKIDGIEALIKAESVKNKGVIVHKEKGKTMFLPKRTPTFNTNRTKLVITLLENLTKNYDPNQIKIHFDWKCTQVDFASKTVAFEKASVGENREKINVNYDLLMGTDGSHSVVRKHFLATESFDFEQKHVRSRYKTVFIPGSNEKAGIDLQRDCLHVWRPYDGIAFGAVPQLDGSFIGLLFFNPDDRNVVDLATKEDAMLFFHKYIPEVGHLISESEVEAFLKRPPSPQLKIRCHPYHYGDSVLILGDAAHAISSSLGQGCNVAFEDVMLLDRLLDEYSEKWEDALRQFTIQRQPDAEALSELDNNVFPTSKALFTEFILRENFARVMNKLWPNIFKPALRDLIADSTIPFADILKSHQKWISRVKDSNQKLMSKKGG